MIDFVSVQKCFDTGRASVDLVFSLINCKDELRWKFQSRSVHVNWGLLHVRVMMYIHIHDLYIRIGEHTYCLAHKWNQFALCFRFELGMVKWIKNHNKLWESSTKGRSGASEDMASSTAEFRAKLIEKLTLGVAQSLGKVHGTARFQELTRTLYCQSSYITFTVKI